MKTLLHLNSSLYSRDGQSSRLADRFVADWRAAHRDGIVLKRDLGRDPVPHLTAERFGAFLAKTDARTPEQQAGRVGTRPTIRARSSLGGGFAPALRCTHDPHAFVDHT